MNRFRKVRLPLLALLALVAAAALFRGAIPALSPAQPADASYEEYRSRTSVALSGYFRDFSPADGAAGHPDFGLSCPDGGGRFAEIAADQLGPDGTPVFRSGGRRVTTQWRDSQNRPIIPARPYIDARAGDQPGLMSAADAGAVTSALSFSQWFRDVPGVNTTARGQFVLARQSPSEPFTFDGYLEGPTPAGNAQASDGNASTTYAADTLFIFERGAGQFLEVDTDASVWVYVDGKLVIDGGGAAALPWEFTGIAVDGPIVLRNNSTIDVADGTDGAVSTNSTSASAVQVSSPAEIRADLLVGPGGAPGAVVQGAANVTGTVAALTEPIALPSINFPSSVGASRGDVTYSGQPVTLTESFRCDTFRLDGDTVATAQGNIVVVCDGDFIMRNTATLQVAPGSSFDVYTRGRVIMDNRVWVNTVTRDPSLVTIYATTSSPIELPNNTEIYANFVAPNATMTVGNGVHVYGSFFGAGITVENGAQFTIYNAGTSGRSGSQLRMSQRIDLDRLGWLQHRRTYPLRIFFADRNQPKSPLRLLTNIDTLNLAVPPPMLSERD